MKTNGRMSPIAALFKLVWWITIGALLGFLGDMAFSALGSIIRGDFRLPFSFVPSGPGAFIGLAAGTLVGLFTIARSVQAPSRDKAPRI